MMRGALSLKVFLVALAIMDDLLAVLTITLFYSQGINGLALLVSAGLVVCLLACNVLGIRRPIVYALLGVLLWLAVLHSGIHATVAGVLLALTIPVRSRIDASTFVNQSHELRQGEAPGVGLLMDERQQTAIAALVESADAIQTPLQRIEHTLSIPVSFGIIPLFVLANAGGSFSASAFLHALLSPLTRRVLAGLVVGKQIGIFLSCWILVKLRWAQLPDEVTWRHVYGVS